MLTSDQSRWDQKGLSRLREIDANPEAFVIEACPIRNRFVRAEFLQAVGPLAGKKILDVGCGRGDLSVFMAQQGAIVTAVDVGAQLLAAGRRLAEVNRTECTFVQASMTRLPLASEQFDVVVGLYVLHHLTRSEMPSAMSEVWRVLKPSGTALFHEPVEDSRAFDFLQNIVPIARRDGANPRPSVLQRRRWTEWRARADDRTMTRHELASEGARNFQDVGISSHGLFCRLTRIAGRQFSDSLDGLDRFLLTICPPLRRYGQTALVRYSGRRVAPIVSTFFSVLFPEYPFIAAL